MSRFIEIAGKKLPVKFTLRSLKEYERITGRPLIAENYLDIIQLTLGVDAMVAFVYCSIYVEIGAKPEITIEEIELNLSLDGKVQNVVVEEYTDFMPGFAAIKKQIESNPELMEKLRSANNDPEKIKALYDEMLSLPNGQSQEA